MIWRVRFVQCINWCSRVHTSGNSEEIYGLYEKRQRIDTHSHTKKKNNNELPTAMALVELGRERSKKRERIHQNNTTEITHWNCGHRTVAFN